MPEVYLAHTSSVNDARTLRATIAYPAHVQQDTEHKKTIGQRLASAREESELTQTDVGTHCGVTKATVSGWETGKNYPDLGQFARMVRLYKTTAEHILFGAAGISGRAADLAARLDGIADPAQKRWTFANVESIIVNAENYRPNEDTASASG